MIDQAESQEATSASDYSLNLSFENINYRVRPAIFIGGHKTILKGICGTFNSGELTVIVGQSGVGKTSLMDILAGYTKPTSGSMYINGQRRNEAAFRRRSCYMLQNNQIQQTLTAHESLSFAAELRLGNHVKDEQKKKRVTEIITSLGLTSEQNTKTGELSGGQRKRLAIGLELITDPPVMFLDEPTSGVDSSITKQLVYLLHQLSRQGRMVVITMHQPSALLMPLMDRLYVIVDGRCAYTGSFPSLIPFLHQANLVCPPYHNPVDFLIEVGAENANELVSSSGNGRSNEWNKNIEGTDNRLTERHLMACADVCLTSLPLPNQDKKLMALKNTHPTTFWKQFTTLTRRSFLSMRRDPTFAVMITGTHFLISLLVGSLFYNTGEDAKYVRHNFNLLFMNVTFLMFTSLTAVTISFPLQIPIIRREHFNGWYSAGAYFMSTFVTTLSLQIVCSLIYSHISYWMTGQPPEFIRLLGFSWVLVLVSFVALSIGLLNGAIFNVTAGAVSGPLILMPYILFSGFFLPYSETPFFLKWIFHISFVKHGLVGLVLTIFGMDREKLPCSDVYCYYTVPIQFLKDMEMLNQSYALVVGALFAIGSTFLILSYFILKIRLKNKW